jgi:hypothetical protein
MVEKENAMPDTAFVLTKEPASPIAVFTGEDAKQRASDAQERKGGYLADAPLNPVEETRDAWTAHIRDGAFATTLKSKIDADPEATHFGPFIDASGSYIDIRVISLISEADAEARAIDAYNAVTDRRPVEKAIDTTDKP